MSELDELGAYPKTKTPKVPLWLLVALDRNKAAVLAAAERCGVEIDKPLLGQDLTRLRQECQRVAPPPPMPRFTPPAPGFGYRRRKDGDE